MNESEHDEDPDREFVELMKRHQKAVQAGQMDEADALTQELFATIENVVVEGPPPEWAYVEEARNCELAGDWYAAEVAYRKALELTDAAGDAVWQMKAYSDLSSLFGLVGNWDLALAHARLATEHARRSDSRIPLAETLGLGPLSLEARFALKCNLVSDALTTIQEALQILESKHEQSDIVYSRFLVLRAECFRRSGEFERADADLETAKGHLEPLEAMELAGGVHSGITEWWTIKARLLASCNGCSDSLHAWSKAVASSRHVANLPHCAGPHSDNVLAALIWELGQALLAAGCAQEARDAIAESRALRDKIGLPPFT
jgi:tetratricopeptide (TPR) repeat protein